MALNLCLHCKPADPFACVSAAPGISASPAEDNLRYFNVMILGPQQSPYEGGAFKLELFLPSDYPMAPPKVGCGSSWCWISSRSMLGCAAAHLCLACELWRQEGAGFACSAHMSALKEVGSLRSQRALKKQGADSGAHVHDVCQSSP